MGQREGIGGAQGGIWEHRMGHWSPRKRNRRGIVVMGA